MVKHTWSCKTNADIGRSDVMEPKLPLLKGMKSSTTSKPSTMSGETNMPTWQCWLTMPFKTFPISWRRMTKSCAQIIPRKRSTISSNSVRRRWPNSSPTLRLSTSLNGSLLDRHLVWLFVSTTCTFQFPCICNMYDSLKRMNKAFVIYPSVLSFIFDWKRKSLSISCNKQHE